MLAVPTRPGFPRIYHRDGAPDLWLAAEGPCRTSATDAGDVSDLTGNVPAAIRAAGCQWVDSPAGPAVRPGPAGHARLAGYAPTLRSWTVTALVVMAPDNDLDIGRILSQQAGQWWGLVIRNGQVTALSSLDGITYPAGDGFGPQLNDGRLHHVAAVRDVAGGEFRLCLDGRVTRTFAISSTDAYDMPGVDVFLSSYIGNSSECFDGSIADCQLYSRALSSEEVAREAADLYWRLAAPAPVDLLLGAAPAPNPATGSIGLGRVAVAGLGGSARAVPYWV